MAKSDSELMRDVGHDVDAYIKTLRAVDPGASDESYERLRDRLCSTIYEMRTAGSRTEPTPAQNRSLRALAS